MASFFDCIPGELEEAASIDGSGRFYTLFHIIMPLVVPGLLAVGVYSFLMTWDDYLHAITLIRSNDLWTLSQGLKLTYHQRSYSRSSERLKGENRYVGDERK